MKAIEQVIIQLPILLETKKAVAWLKKIIGWFRIGNSTYKFDYYSHKEQKDYRAKNECSRAEAKCFLGRIAP